MISFVWSMLLPPPNPQFVPTGGQDGTRPLRGADELRITDADRVLQRYRDIGAAQEHRFGEAAIGSEPPDFNFEQDPVPVEEAVEGQRDPTQPPVAAAQPEEEQ